MWAHKPWQGRYLPAGLHRNQTLSAYATWCTSVEGNTTFYGLPSASTVASWAAAAPADFRFVFKLPRTVTHERRLRDVTDEMRTFLSLVEPLGERARTLSVQLPASFGPTDLDTLDRFLGRMPAAHRCGVEVRHPEFFALGADGGPGAAGAALSLGAVPAAVPSGSPSTPPCCSPRPRPATPNARAGRRSPGSPAAPLR